MLAKQISLEPIFGTGLSHRVRIIVPSTFGLSGKLPENQKTAFDEFIGRQLSALFGGMTQYAGIGGYVADNGEYVRENVTVIESSCNDLSAHQQYALELIVKWLHSALKQEAISIYMDDTLHFYPPFE